ncbi:MAG: hypothetical protein HY827_06935 [Actinobacteria bacterium]|nr:hypothetical protein [Actinomycetota bacterium]
MEDGDYTFSVTAYNGLSDDPTPATTSFTVGTGSGYDITSTVTPSTTQAAAHPNLDATVNITGGQPQSVSIKLPAGLNASLSARNPLCDPYAEAFSGNCPASTTIGTLQLTVAKFGGDVAGIGDVFLTSAPTGEDAGGIAVKVNLPGVGDFIALGGANLVNNGNNQNLSIRDFPTNINGTDITVKQLVLHLDGVTGNLMTNPTSCTANDGFQVDSTAFDSSQAEPVLVAFQATGCGSVPFGPNVNQVVTDPVAGHLTGIKATITTVANDSNMKSIRVTEPPALAPNYPSFGNTDDMCPSEAAPDPDSIFDEYAGNGCPAQSLVGTMQISTPLLPFDLYGNVYLIDKAPLPWFGVAIDSSGIRLRLTGVTSTPQVDPLCNPATTPLGYCQTQISVVFNNLPDVPLTQVIFDLNGPDRTGNSANLSGKLLKVASAGSPACASGPAKSAFEPFSAPGTYVNRTQTISVTGC